jgi:YidC/Oxa1 family membrane protein insertase
MKLFVLMLAFAAADAAGESLVLAGERQRIDIGLQGGLPVAWQGCAPDCAVKPPFVLLSEAPQGGRLRIVVPGDAAQTDAINALQYGYELREADGRWIAVLTAATAFNGRALQQQYALDQHGRMLSMSLQLPPGAKLEFTGGRVLVPEEYPGFGGLYSNARAVAVGVDGQESLAEEGEEPVVNRALPAGDWAGLRGRFWTVMFRSEAPLVVDASELTLDEPVLRLGAASGAGADLELTAYAGPVARADLAAAAPQLEGMLYAVLWNPLRWLSFGLQWMLDRWQDLVGSAWLAILLLSLSVKLLMAPLIAIAERWQADVNRKKSLLEPELAAIRRGYKGEDAHNRTLAVYRRHGVSHFYTFKSLAGFMIQIPVFIAAFDMLGENFRLAGEPFLWIEDLASPDQFAALPFVLPFFGGHLNLLPIVMTLFTVLAARLQEEPSLAPELRQGVRLRLYAMAGVFFALLYTFPAAMVLYWTANNFWHLLRVLVSGFTAGAARNSRESEPRPRH